MVATLDDPTAIRAYNYVYGATGSLLVYELMTSLDEERKAWSTNYLGHRLKGMIMNTGANSRDDVAGSWVQPCFGCGQARCKKPSTAKVFVITPALPADILNQEPSASYRFKTFFLLSSPTFQEECHVAWALLTLSSRRTMCGILSAYNPLFIGQCLTPLQPLGSPEGECLCGHALLAHATVPALPPRGDVSRRVALVLVSLMHLLLGGHGASTLYADACISHMPLCLWGTLQQSPTRHRWSLIPLYLGTLQQSLGRHHWSLHVHPPPRKVAANHAAWGPISGESMPRGPHRSFTGSGSQRLGKAPAKVKPVPPPTASIFFVLYPLLMFHSMLDDGGYPELYPRSPRLHDGDRHYLHAAHHSLVFEYPVPVDPSHVFYADFNDWLLAEMRCRMLHFSPSFATTHPLFNAQPDTPAWHAMRFLDFKWSLVKIGNKQRAEREDAGRILTLPDHQWHAFTVSGLKASKLGLNNPGTVGQSYYLIGVAQSWVLPLASQRSLLDLEWLFFRVVTNYKKRGCTKSGCSGIPILKKLREGPSKDGKLTFIGCSKWDKGEKFAHRYAAIPADVDEYILRKYLDGSAVPPADLEAHAGVCARFSHPRHGKQTDCRE
ncbi:hypothetical protein B0H10DRAFT_2237001 [Mycena sp. CBHHK59/15]|nr:hypothetical protein B0H10DRAFT_2237001 [Mycena sp. CBHHK59/15]